MSGEPAGTADLATAEPGSAAHDEQAAQLRAAAYVVLALAVLGALLGVVWQAWSPAGPFGIIYQNGVQPDETEAWAAADGRFALLVAVAGLAAGVAAWFLRRARGPQLVLALVAGGLAGAALTEWVGHLIRGSADTFTCYPASGPAQCTRHLPLALHMWGLLYIEPALAVLGYGLFVAFTARDDLGRPDPIRGRLSVDLGWEPDNRWGYGDGPGPLEQRDLPAQQPVESGEPLGGGRDVQQ